MTTLKLLKKLICIALIISMIRTSTPINLINNEVNHLDICDNNGSIFRPKG